MDEAREGLQRDLAAAESARSEAARTELADRLGRAESEAAGYRDAI